MGRWMSRFDEEVLAAARVFAGKARQLRLQADGSGGFVLMAAVAGEEVEVMFWPAADAWEFESACSCGLGSFCHHAAAALMRVEKEGGLRRLPANEVSTAVTAMMTQVPVETETETAIAPGLREIAPEPVFALHVRREPVDRGLALLLQSLGQPPAEHWILAEAVVDYDGHRLPLRGTPPGGPRRVRLADGSEALLRHAVAAEHAALRALTEAGLSSLQSNPAWRFIFTRRLRAGRGDEVRDRWMPDPARIAADAFWHRFRGESVATLESLGWRVTIDDSVGHRVFEADPSQWNASLEGSGGWFHLSVGFEVDGVRHDLLPILANLIETDVLEETLHHPGIGHIYAPLPGGDALKLPADRVRRILHHLAALLDRGFPARTRLHALDAAALAALPGIGLDLPHEVAALTQALADTPEPTRDPPAVDPPAGLHATLRDYQLAGFRWMRFLAANSLHGILADDMGLGKTLQTLAHILAEKEAGHLQGRPALVIAPTSVIPNWQAEARRFAPGLRVLVLDGAGRRRDHAVIPHADVVLTSYALLHRDIDALRSFPFRIVALDEAQSIKNPSAKVAQAARSLDADLRLCLSGTPVENHLGELWSLMHFLMPGFLGSQERFDAHYRRPVESHGDAERAAELRQRLAPLILRRTKDQVAKELPPKTELVHLIELHTAQKDLYETVRATMNKRVREAIAARGMDGFQMVFLEALLKLRQICCDPRLLDDDFARHAGASAKLDFLTELLGVLVDEGRRILLFSQFTSMLSLIEQHLERQSIPFLKLTGSSKDRGALVAEFQSGKVPLFLISLKAGGTGLNLTAADTVIHYDPWWNPAVEAQATDRAYRIGQDKPVFVHKLICQDTVEQRIHRMQQEKQALADDLLAESRTPRNTDPAMVQALLGDDP